MDIVKTGNAEWGIGSAKTITFIVTKDCQLACKYCYLVGKNSNERMSFDTAVKAIDYTLDNRDPFQKKVSFGNLSEVNHSLKLI